MLKNLLTMSQKSYAAGSTYPTMKGRLRIYSMRFCPFAQRTRLVLAHKNISHETVNVDLRRKPDWFLQRNPFGLVPTLELHGNVIYESNICSQYLDDAYPKYKLTPSDPCQKASDQILIDTFSKVLDPFYKIARTGEDIDKMSKNLQRYETELVLRGNYFGGNQPCMVDYAIWPWLERMPLLEEKGFKLSADEFPNLVSYIKRMYELPAVKATMFDRDSHLHFFKSYQAGNPDFDYGL